MRIKVSLNGTSENPFHRLGLEQNPFPQIADRRYQHHLLHLAKLGATPIPNCDYIRTHLIGWSEEFVNLLCEQFVLGKIVEFEVEWKE